jgi:hypothetical protein
MLQFFPWKGKTFSLSASNLFPNIAPKADMQGGNRIPLHVPRFGTCIAKAGV